MELHFMHGSDYVRIVEDESSRIDENGDEVVEPGYQYTVYHSKEAEEPLEGGFCSGSLSDAIEMAIN